jgi:hypothetical protein
MSNWIFDLFDKKPLQKEAASSQGTNREDHFSRKLKENDWLAGAIKEADGGEGFDEVGQIMAYEQGDLDTPAILNLFSELIKNGHAWSLQGSYGRTAKALIDNGYLSQEGEILKGLEGQASFRLPMVKLAAYTLGDDMKETIEKDYELAVSGMSDYNIAEMLTELACDSGETMLEAADELHAKNVEYVKKNRSAAEGKLLKAVGEHTLVDWKEAFKKFRNAKPYKIDEKELYEDDLKSNKFNEKVPGEKAYDGLSDKEHKENMEGIGKEEEKGQVGKDASLKTADHGPQGLACKKCWRPLDADGTCSDKTCPYGHMGQDQPLVKQPDPAVVQRVEQRPDIAPHIISEKKQHTEDCMDANDDTSVFKGKCICPKEKEASLKLVAYHAGDKAYYHGKPCTVKDISLNQYSGEANVEIEVEGESFHLSGKELKELGKEALTPEMEHPVEAPIEPPVEEIKPEPTVPEDVVKEPEVLAPVEEIASKASKADVIKKVAEISSPWIVAKDEQGNDVIKRADDQDPAAPKDIQK